jgi:hypothetical protein
MMILRSVLIRFIILLMIACGLSGIASAQIGGDSGYFEITSTPSGAGVTFDGSYKGLTPVTFEVSTTGNPSHTISLTKQGYQPWEDTYQGNPFEGETIHINGELVYIPITLPTTPIGSGQGYYAISSSPQGGSVYFDGQYRGIAPVTVPVYTDGTPGHTISVSLSGYQTWSQNYPGNPADGQTIYVTAYLNPVETYGSISVDSSPSQATAVLDGGISQITPCTFNNVYPGSHTVMVSKSGYSSWSRTVTVTAGRNTAVTATLSQLPPNTGSIYMVTVPQGASAYVDGAYYGITPALASNLNAGTHQVRLSLSGFQDWVGNVNVAGGSTITVSQTLTIGPTSTATPVPGTGSIAASSNPSGAQVFLDNNYVGISPLTIPSVQPGMHTVLIKQSGYADWQATQTVQGGQVTYVDATLSPSPSPPPTPTKGGIPAVMVLLGLFVVVVLSKRR